jgi:signal transduction histidine kinase/CheY-like chemotaxis protein
MTLPILTVAIRNEHDTVTVRQRSRQIARLLGFDTQDQTRIATAVSEIARNAFRYAGGGRVEFVIEGNATPQLFIINVTDEGPGIRNLKQILDGRYTSTTGMGMGIVGTRRLMDQFDIESSGTGTRVSLKKVFPRRAGLVTPAALAVLTKEMAAEKPRDAFAEMELQNQELLRSLDELRKKQDDLTRVNRELEDTNRGVVALYAELDEKADHLRRADELKSKFLSNMSHEFRSPLNSILALTDLLLGHSDGPLNSEQTQQVGFVRRAADDLYELVNDLLDLAKVEAGKVEVKPLHFEVENLFGALRGMLRPLFLNQSVALVFEDSSELPPLYSDEGKISQILRNFLSNALKFTERGEVRVSAASNEGRIRFTVADTGIGIAKEDQGRIFQDFVQVDGPLQRKVKGTGLGLPLSKKLAQLLRGDVEVSSVAGQGSTFSLDIPLQWEAAEVAVIEIPDEDNHQGIPVLMVENRADTLMLYSRWLRNSEFRMVPAGSTREAERRLGAERPAVMVLDVFLEGEDTWNLLASVKNSPETRDIPVLMVTTADDARKAFHLGANEYMVKPVARDMLLGCLRRLTALAPPAQVLIIDDDEKDRYILKHRLRDTGLQIVEASSGAAGIAKAVESLPQLIFLDLSMPGMSGFEVLNTLKANPRTESIAVVIHTSRTVGETEQQRLGAAAAIIYKSQINQEGAFDKLVERMGESGKLLRRSLEKVAEKSSLERVAEKSSLERVAGNSLERVSEKKT